jgi:CBS-domain-containing membrane protein
MTVEAPPRLTLWADTAADLMMPSPMSLRAEATVREAITVLTDRGFSAAPVIDEAGRPIGVLSRGDILVHDREKSEHPRPASAYYEGDLRTGAGERLGGGFQVEQVDQTRVRDIMTPAVFSVAPETAAAKVIEEMLALKVHRLFVVDSAGVLIGVISALDVLRHLRP